MQSKSNNNNINNTMDTITICTIIATAIAVIGALGSILALCVTIGRYTERFKNIEANYAALHESSNKQQERLIRVEDMLMFKHKDAPDYFAAKRSPRALNELGMKVFEDMKGQEFLNKNKDILFSKITNAEPKTALDVEQAAFNACVSISNMDIFNDIKVFVYNYPTVQVTDEDNKEVGLGDAIFILSLPLRDMYLKEHLEIPR